MKWIELKINTFYMLRQQHKTKIRLTQNTVESCNCISNTQVNKWNLISVLIPLSKLLL